MEYLSKIYLILLISIFISCGNTEKNEANKSVTPTDSISNSDKKIIRAIGEILTPDAKKKVETWKEYQQLDDFLDNFYSSSSDEALNLSKELSKITKQLKDSVKIERFKQPDVSIRINVIHNYVLRLYDMSTIPSISDIEVQDETQNILDAFSALNSKINTLTKQEKLETELKNFTAPVEFEYEEKTTSTLSPKEKLQ